MRICQINPGILEIPPKNWGAVEKIIWNYHQSLTEKGHLCDIKYLDEINKVNDYDVVHLHVANLAEETYKRNIPYFLSLHDHHIFLDDENEKSLLEYYKSVIDKSILTFTHCYETFKHINNKKLVYLPHGVDGEKYWSKNRDLQVPRVLDFLCVGNNGLWSDPTIDRKGFIDAVNFVENQRKISGIEHNLTFLSPSNSKPFFEKNKDTFNKEWIRILYDKTEDELINFYKEWDIFLHFSWLEIGQPNLTLTEAAIAGLPIIGYFEDSKQNQFKNFIIDKENFKYKAIADFNFEEYYKNIDELKPDYYWSNVTDKLLEHYNSNLVFENKIIDYFKNLKRIENVYNLENYKIVLKENALYIVLSKNLENRSHLQIFKNGQPVYDCNFVNTGDWTEVYGSKNDDWSIIDVLTKKIIFTKK